MSDAVDLETFEDFEKARENSGRVVILFTSPSWCVPCQQMEKHWSRITSEEDDVKFYRVLELDSHPWAVVECGITSQPTSLLYEDGELVKQIVGARSALQFLAEIRS